MEDIAGLLEGLVAEPKYEDQKAEQQPGPSQRCTEEDRRAILGVLSAKFKIPIKRIIKYTGDPGQYRLETPTGAVQLGGVEGLITQSKLRRSLADATGRYLPTFEKKDWDKDAQLLLVALEIVDRGEDATIAGVLMDQLSGYLREKTVHSVIEKADEGREPFVNAGAVHIFVDNFRSWLQIRRGERIPRNRLTADLRACEVVPTKIPLMSEGKETSRSVWRLPSGPWDNRATEASGKR